MAQLPMILVISIYGLGILVGQPFPQEHTSSQDVPASGVILLSAFVRQEPWLIGSTTPVSVSLRLGNQGPDLTGNWHVIFATKEGALTARLTLRQRGEILEAVLEIDNHTLAGVWLQVGNTLEITVEDADNRIELAAEVQSGEFIGTWKNDDGERGSWKGSREVEPPAQVAFSV